MEEIKTVVSVITITYNHEPFIAKTIEGVLMQQVNFPMEFIIAEDCSSDGTRAICERYWEQYPELIRLITSKSNVGAVANERRAMQTAQGKYIAFCEGDDYWTDPLKLQKQVDFLEKNPEYSVCFHRYRNYDDEKGNWKDDGCSDLFNDCRITGCDISTELFFSRWITQPLSMVYRRSSFDLDIALQYNYYRDMHQIYHLLQTGKGYLFAFDGGVRIIHQEGMHSMTSVESQCEVALNIASELYKINKNKIVKKYFEDTLQWVIYEYCGRLKNKNRALIYTFMLFFYQKKIGRFGANFKRVLR